MFISNLIRVQSGADVSPGRSGGQDHEAAWEVLNLQAEQ